MSEVRLERDGPIATIVVDRPGARNAIDRAAMATLESIVGELEADEGVACTILTGGGSAFVAGGDLKDLAGIPNSEDGRRMSRWMGSVVSRLDGLPCPTIAAIGGDAHGGGCELALACDVRVIQQDANMVFRQVAMGLTPGWGGGQRLARLVGRSAAILLYATAAVVSAEDALRIGLVDRVVADPQSDARALATTIAEHSPLAVRNTKRAIVRGAEMPLGAAIDYESELFARTWGSDHHRAAVRRFLDRRKGAGQG